MLLYLVYALILSHFFGFDNFEVKTKITAKTITRHAKTGKVFEVSNPISRSGRNNIAVATNIATVSTNRAIRIQLKGRQARTTEKNPIAPSK
jgi:hypothetical protein